MPALVAPSVPQLNDDPMEMSTGSAYKTAQILISNWLTGKSNTYGALDLNVEQTLKEHFGALGIAFKKELSHIFQCDCGSELPCRVFYYLDVS